jgi:hypothetical protein
MDETEIWDLWLELKVDHILIEYSCGSDDTYLEGTMIYDQSGSQIYSNELTDYFEEKVFKKVDFVDATDNYYLGESGTVKITMVEKGYSLDYDDEGKEFKDYWYEFIYNKKGEEKYLYKIQNKLFVPLEESTINLINDKLTNIYGSHSTVIVNLKNDTILTEEENILLEKLKLEIDKLCKEFNPQSDKDIIDWYDFGTYFEKHINDGDEILEDVNRDSNLILFSNDNLILYIINYHEAYEEYDEW